MTQIELKLTLSETILAQLRDIAQQRGLSVDAIVSEVVEDFFDDPTDEEILQGIREGMLDALAGRTRPAREVLAELKQNRSGNADAG